MSDDELPVTAPRGLTTQEYYGKKALVEFVRVGDEISVKRSGGGHFNAIVSGESVQGRHLLSYSNGPHKRVNLSRRDFFFRGQAEVRVMGYLMLESHEIRAFGVRSLSQCPAIYKRHAKKIRVGDELAVYWPSSRRYFLGDVTRVYEGGICEVVYENGLVEESKMDEEVFRFIGRSARRVYQHNFLS